MHVGDMDKALRGITPLPFALYLLSEVRRRYSVYTVAVLYCDLSGPYIGLPGVECWPLWAERYSGPHPIIAHPPCEAWGRFAWKARQDRRHCGIDAMLLVHAYGGVVEHPWRSKLFIQHGRENGTIETVNQSDYGHVCRKRTDLYWVSRCAYYRSASAVGADSWA